MQMDSDFSTRGVPIHADHATVSLNLFATPDDGRVDGGGLQLYHVLPEDGLKSEEYNFPPDYWAIEQNRKVLDSYEKVTIPYAYNRAVLFRSDFYHQTETFHFKSGFENRRINVAMVWGEDRGSGLWEHRPSEFRSAAEIPRLDMSQLTQRPQVYDPH